MFSQSYMVVYFLPWISLSFGWCGTIIYMLTLLCTKSIVNIENVWVFSSHRLASGSKPPLWKKTRSQWHICRIGWAWVNNVSEPWSRKQSFWLLYLPCQRNIHSFRVASVLAVGWAKVAFLCIRAESRKKHLEVPTVVHTFPILPPMFLWENQGYGGRNFSEIWMLHIWSLLDVIWGIFCC